MSIHYFQDPDDENGPCTITPQEGQTIRILIPDTHRAGPAADRDGCVEVRPLEGK